MLSINLILVLSFAAAATLIVVIGARLSNILYVLLSERGLLSFGKLSPRQARKAKTITHPSADVHLVYYSSPRRFWRHIKLLPWDAFGEFQIGEFDLEFNGQKRNGEPIKLSFPKFDSLMTYVPANFLRDGGLTWVAIGSLDELHYFTCGIAPLNLSSTAGSTTGFYEAVTDTFVREKVSVAGGE